MKWSADEVAFLTENYPKKGVVWCAEHLNRTVPQVRAKASRLKLRSRGTSEAWVANNAKHSPDTKDKISQALKQNWQDPEYRKNALEASYQSRKARAAINGGVLTVNNRESASWKAGWREIGGTKKYYRSRWEANYARYLDWLKQRGEIADWKHEPTTFWFEGIRRGAASYLPDFWVLRNDGGEEYREVKGWMDARSKTKIKRMAKYHPKVALIVIDAKAYKALEKTLKSIVPDWETSEK